MSASLETLCNVANSMIDIDEKTYLLFQARSNRDFRFVFNNPARTLYIGKDKLNKYTNAFQKYEVCEVQDFECSVVAHALLLLENNAIQCSSETAYKIYRFAFHSKLTVVMDKIKPFIVNINSDMRTDHPELYKKILNSSTLKVSSMQNDLIILGMRNAIEICKESKNPELAQKALNESIKQHKSFVNELN